MDLSNRHPGVRDGVAWLGYDHLPPQLQQYSKPFHDAALLILQAIPVDSPELTTAINKLIEAKDSAVRAGIRAERGSAGSVPRPQQIVHPPELAESAVAQEMIDRTDLPHQAAQRPVLRPRQGQVEDPTGRPFRRS